MSWRARGLEPHLVSRGAPPPREKRATLGCLLGSERVGAKSEARTRTERGGGGSASERVRGDAAGTKSPRLIFGAPGRSRTSDPRLRRPMLFPLSYGRVRSLSYEKRKNVLRQVRQVRQVRRVRRFSVLQNPPNLSNPPNRRPTSDLALAFRGNDQVNRGADLFGHIVPGFGSCATTTPTGWAHGVRIDRPLRDRAQLEVAERAGKARRQLLLRLRGRHADEVQDRHARTGSP